MSLKFRADFRVFVLVLLVSFAPAAWAEAQTPDRSLTPEQYVSKGAPTSDRRWVGRDYVTAAKVLGDLASTDISYLPRCQSSKSGSYFARMVSTDNLADVDNKKLPLENRLRLLVDSGQSLNCVVLLYAEKRTPQCTFDQELVLLMAHNLRIFARALPLIDEFSGVINPSDPKYAKWTQALAKIKEGAVAMVDGALNTLENGKAYRASVRAQYAGEMRQTVPAIMRVMPPMSRNQLTLRVKRMAGDEPDAALREQLQALAQAMGR